MKLLNERHRRKRTGYPTRILFKSRSKLRGMKPTGGNKSNLLKILLLWACLVLPSTGFASPIHDAALTGDVELMEMLIANGADVNDRDVQGYTPLLLAIQEGNTDVAKILITNGADVNTRAASDGGNDVTPLYLSIILGRGGLATLLRSNGATGPQAPVDLPPASPRQ